jgi:CRP/FNR family transcriptional regulator, cyclic AMP receptor protein
MVLHELKTEDFLRKIVIFKDLSQQSINRIEKRIQSFSFKKGDQVISEDDTARGVYFVHSGAVKLTKQDENGNEVIVCIKQNGDLFAEACLFTQKTENYPATATILLDGRVLFLDKMALERDLYDDPELAIQMIRYMSDSLRDMTALFVHCCSLN